MWNLHHVGSHIRLPAYLMKYDTNHWHLFLVLSIVDDLTVIFADVWSFSFHSTFAVYFLRHCLNHGQIMTTAQYISSGLFFGRVFAMDCSWRRMNSRTSAVTLIKCRGKCLDQRRTKQLNNYKILCKNKLRNWHRSAVTVKWLQ